MTHDRVDGRRPDRRLWTRAQYRVDEAREDRGVETELQGQTREGRVPDALRNDRQCRRQTRDEIAD